MTKFLAKVLIVFIFTLFLSENLSSEEIILPKIQPKTDELVKASLLLPRIKPEIDELTKLKIQKKKVKAKNIEALCGYPCQIFQEN